MTPALLQRHEPELRSLSEDVRSRPVPWDASLWQEHESLQLQPRRRSSADLTSLALDWARQRARAATASQPTPASGASAARSRHSPDNAYLPHARAVRAATPQTDVHVFAKLEQRARACIWGRWSTRSGQSPRACAGWGIPDPINNTDPSGFASHGVSDAVSGYATLVGSPQGAGTIYMLLRLGGASPVAGTIGGVFNAGTSLAMGLPGAGSAGRSAGTIVPSAAPKASGGGQQPSNAVAQSAGQVGPPQAGVQERSFEAPQAAADPSVLPGQPCYSESGHCGTTLFIPLPDGTAFLQMGQAVQAAVNAVWRWLRQEELAVTFSRIARHTRVRRPHAATMSA